MRSDKNICGVGKFAIHDGQEQAFHALAEEMSVATSQEEGALTYQWRLAEDGKTCHVLERYADSDAVRTHLQTFGAFADRVMAIADLTSLDIYGSPDAELREALDQFGVKYYGPYAGFVR